MSKLCEKCNLKEQMSFIPEFNICIDCFTKTFSKAFGISKKIVNQEVN